jgi:hypothetical protein
MLRLEATFFCSFFHSPYITSICNLSWVCAVAGVRGSRRGRKRTKHVLTCVILRSRLLSSAGAAASGVAGRFSTFFVPAHQCRVHTTDKMASTESSGISVWCVRFCLHMCKARVLLSFIGVFHFSETRRQISALSRASSTSTHANSPTPTHPRPHIHTAAASDQQTRSRRARTAAQWSHLARTRRCALTWRRRGTTLHSIACFRLTRRRPMCLRLPPSRSSTRLCAATIAQCLFMARRCVCAVSETI